MIPSSCIGRAFTKSTLNRNRNSTITETAPFNTVHLMVVKIRGLLFIFSLYPSSCGQQDKIMEVS
uniref:Uncharacterized protein n=1 Tax=Takifugu rubripes TaxID=31033 RepID=A0A674PD86_TAKRU